MLLATLKKWGKTFAAALIVAAASALPGRAAVNMEAGTGSTNKLTFAGDFRVRHESFFNKSAGQVDRHRERFRLRFGAKMEMDKWEMGLRLASGTGEQTSTNQTMGNAWNQKNIYIDQAYATWKTTDWLRMTGGKMENPFYRTYASDLVWDGDLNPEGFAQGVSFDVGEMINLFGNFAQLPVNEISGGVNSAKDPWLFGNQIGVKTKLGGGFRWDFAMASYAVSHEKNSVLHSTSAFDSSVLQGDNTRIPGSTLLAGQYHMLHLTTQIGFQLFLPIRLQGDFVRNVHEEKTNGADEGYQLGFILGSAKNKGGLEAGYFHKYVEANATLSDFADSDWGNGGTNRKGHIVWLGYGFTDYLTLQSKYFMTKRVNPFVSASTPYADVTTAQPRDINRLQVDLVLKF